MGAPVPQEGTGVPNLMSHEPFLVGVGSTSIIATGRRTSWSGSCGCVGCSRAENKVKAVFITVRRPLTSHCMMEEGD